MKRTLIAAIAACAASVALVSSAGLAQAAAKPGPVTVYDATQTPLPGNVSSVGFEANSISEFGDEVMLDGTARQLKTVTVTMSSWACQSGAWNTGDCVSANNAKYAMPITISLYKESSTDDNGVVTRGSLLTRTTRTVEMPYRPTANLKKCNSTNSSTGKWYDAKSGKCVNGKAFNVVANFTSLKQTLPDDVVVGIAFNTTHNGATPYGDQSCTTANGGCFYDSLNVGASGVPSIGAETYPGTVFQNTTSPASLCDSTPLLGVFNLDSSTSACWDGYSPNIKITAS